MSDKIKNILFLLFIVSALLLMIGSISATSIDELNDNLETSYDLDNSLSVNEDDSTINLNNKVSSQVAISDVDEETEVTSQNIGENLTKSNVVSNTEDNALGAKDSEDKLSSPNIILQNKVLNPQVKVGDVVSFEVFGRNYGDTFTDEWIPINMLFSHEEFEYLGFTPGVNPDVPYLDFSGNYAELDKHLDSVQFGYHANGEFLNGHCFNFTVHFKALKAGNPGTCFFIDWNQGQAIDRTTVTQDPIFTLENKVLDPQVKVGDVVSFEVFGRNIGGTYTDEWIPINMLFSHEEFEYLGFTPGVNPDVPYLDFSGNYAELDKQLDSVQFGYHANGEFLNGHCFNFTVHFKALKLGNPGTCFFIDWNQGQAINRTIVANDADFALQNKALNQTALVDKLVSFEIFARNLGGNFNQEWIPIDVYFNPEELQYVGFVPGVNPDMPYTDFSSNYPEPRVYDGHVQFGYHAGNWFDNGHCFNFTVIFKALKEGQVGTTAVINWNQASSHQVSSSNSTNVRRDADFKLEFKPTPLIVNVKDNVTFEVFVRNVGGTYNGEYAGVDVWYNPSELQYLGFEPGRNPDNGWYFEDAYPPPIVDAENGHILFGYRTDFNFINGYCFNFTINFKSLKEGKIQTSAGMDWWQVEHHHIDVTNYTFVTDADFVLDNVPLSEELNIGDVASFEIIAHNRNGAFYGSYISFDVYFNTEYLEYVNFTVKDKPNGRFSLESDVLGLSSNSNDIPSFDLLGVSDGHLRFGYMPTRSANTDCSFDFIINYNVLNNGKLENNAVLAWAESETQKVQALGIAYAGQADLKLTKEVQVESVSLGDDVYYDVILENVGEGYFTSKNGYFTLDDYYPDGLEYVDYEAKTSGITVNRESGKSHLIIRQSIPSDGWAPGSKLEVTLHFKAVKSGILCNFVFGPKGTSDYSSVIVDEPGLNLTKTTENNRVQLNELVYFDIFVENTGKIPYYNHNDSSKDLIIHDIYPDGLVYQGYNVNSDSQGGKFNIKADGENRLNITYTPDDERWWSGSYINITLIFNATKYGKFTNHANVYWKWKDWDEVKEINLTDNDSVIVGTPKFTVEKTASKNVVTVGDYVRFSIKITNTGNVDLTGVYIKDKYYTQGLSYHDYSDKGSWKFDGVDTWYYNGVLKAGESISLDLVFKATSVGEKQNTAIAGHNITNDTLNSTAKVSVISNSADDNGTEEEPVDEQDADPEKAPVEHESSMPVAGNPLFVLVLCLISLCSVFIRNKK